MKNDEVSHAYSTAVVHTAAAVEETPAAAAAEPEAEAPAEVAAEAEPEAAAETTAEGVTAFDGPELFSLVLCFCAVIAPLFQSNLTIILVAWFLLGRIDVCYGF